MNAVFVLKPLRLYTWGTNKFHLANQIDSAGNTHGAPEASRESISQFCACCPRCGLWLQHDDDDDDGSENVAKKMNLSSFKLNRVYLDPLNMSNVGDFSWSWIPRF